MKPLGVEKREYHPNDHDCIINALFMDIFLFKKKITLLLQIYAEILQGCGKYSQNAATLFPSSVCPIKSHSFIIFTNIAGV